MNNSSLTQSWKIGALEKALSKSESLLEKKENLLNYDNIHSVKSVLYAAIEQVGIRIEKLGTLQRMLRELFVIVTANMDLSDYEREVADQMISEIRIKYEGLIGAQEQIRTP